MERIFEVRDVVGPALLTLGDGNWKMGEGVQVGNEGAKTDVGDEQTVIEHYTCHFFMFLIFSIALFTRSFR